ncbi:MAG: type II toxin-antitoxin system HigB family toxin [Epsilonproteobacteria bacterium]|nr:MAG: type II toxin-antitoxin system HigB family toxin [Campylobacterota bacterium]
MKIVGADKLDKFKKKHPSSRVPLDRWVMVVKAAKWNKYGDIKLTFNSVDKVGDIFVFNIKGNDFRLIAEVIFQGNLVIIKNIWDHKTYDKKQLK